MPSIRLTLVNNAKQTQRSAVVLKVDPEATTSDAIGDIITLAKNKLRLKKAKTLYLNLGVEFTDPAWLLNGKVAQDRYGTSLNLIILSFDILLIAPSLFCFAFFGYVILV